MAAAQGLATDTDDFSQESESEFTTADDSSEVEETNLNEDELTDTITTDEKGY